MTRISPLSAWKPCMLVGSPGEMPSAYQVGEISQRVLSTVPLSRFLSRSFMPLMERQI
jgi:hypothetical protein